MKEAVHYIADFKYVSHISSDRYSSKRQVVEAHIKYIEKSAVYTSGDKNLILENTEKYNKRVNSRVALKTVFALPNDLTKEEYNFWCELIKDVLEQYGINRKYIYIAIHEEHKLQAELGTKNLHAHVVATPIDKNNKPLRTSKYDMKALHDNWNAILEKNGYKIKRYEDPLGKLGWRLRRDEKLLAAYKEHIQAKREQEKMELLAKVMQMTYADLMKFLQSTDTDYAKRLLEIGISVRGKSPDEAIYVLKKQKEQEKDGYVIDFIDFLLMKAEKFKQKQKPKPEIPTNKEKKEQPEPVQKQPSPTYSQFRQPQPPTRQQQPQKPQPEPQPEKQPEQQPQPEPKPNFANKVRQFVAGMKQMENADPQQLVNMLLTAETDKEEKILSEVVARQTTRQARQPQPQPQRQPEKPIYRIEKVNQYDEIFVVFADRLQDEELAEFSEDYNRLILDGGYDFDVLSELKGYSEIYLDNDPRLIPIMRELSKDDDKIVKVAVYDGRRYRLKLFRNDDDNDVGIGFRPGI